MGGITGGESGVCVKPELLGASVMFTSMKASVPFAPTPDELTSITVGAAVPVVTFMGAPEAIGEVVAPLALSIAESADSHKLANVSN